MTKLQDLQHVTHASAAVKYYVIKYVLRYRLRVPYLKGLRTDMCFEFHILLNVWIFEYAKMGRLGDGAQVWTQTFTFHRCLTGRALLPCFQHLSVNTSSDMSLVGEFSTCSLRSIPRNISQRLVELPGRQTQLLEHQRWTGALRNFVLQVDEFCTSRLSEPT